MTRPGADIAFGDSGGQGPVVVLSHGAGLDHSTFDAQSDSLQRQGYRVITWDLRGHGRSELAPGVSFRALDAVADLLALLDECGADAPVLIGHSLGGNIAQAVVSAEPARIGGLVVLGCTWNAGRLGPAERLALRLAGPALSLVPSSSLPRLLARASAVTPEAVARAEAVFSQMTKSRFLQVWSAVASLVEPGAQAPSPVPIALMRGAQDRTGNIAAAMPRWAQVNGVREHLIPAAGHLCTWDNPQAVTDALLTVLGSWSGRTEGR